MGGKGGVKVQITRETDYAIRCLLYLSRKQDEITMGDEIAGEMDIPKSFLAKILQKLARAKIVKSYRGVKGGFQLAKRPDKINLLNVIEAIEGPIAMNICAVDKKMCSLSNKCSVHPVWVRLKRDMERQLEQINFQRLTMQSHKK
jgi:Rrf2 family protein